MMRVVSFFFIFVLLMSIVEPVSAKPDPYLAAAQNNLSFREADSYDVHIAKRDIEVGVERIDKDEMERLLGGDTGKFKIFDVAVTNNSDFRIYVNQIDITDAKGKTYASVDLSEVVDAIDPGGSGNKDDMREAVLRENTLNKSLPHAILNPGETIQGLLYIKGKYMSGDTALDLQIQNLKRVAYLSFSVPLEN